MTDYIEHLAKQQQIVLQHDEFFLYSQLLVGEGYEEYKTPFDMYVLIKFSDNRITIADHNVIEGDNCITSQNLIDWQWLIRYAYEQDLVNHLELFLHNFSSLYVYDENETENFVNELMDMGVL